MFGLVSFVVPVIEVCYNGAGEAGAGLVGAHPLLELLDEAFPFLSSSGVGTA